MNSNLIQIVALRKSKVQSPEVRKQLTKRTLLVEQEIIRLRRFASLRAGNVNFKCNQIADDMESALSAALCVTAR